MDRRTYEVSIWTLQDEFITVLKPLDVENIGQLENKELQLKTDDGINQYSCSIPMYIYKGAERIENPIWYNTLNGNIVSNLRKIKIIINKGAESEEVYEFLIIKVEERHDKDQLYCDITCEDLVFHELGKQGYKISLSSEVYYDKHDKWAKYDGAPETEPRNTLQYWLNQFLEPLPNNPITTQWYYEVQMNWDAYAEGYLRDPHKVYEEEYTSSWSIENGKVVPAAITEYKEKERLVDLEESNIFNLTQDLAEKYEVFVKYKYVYDENYHIRGRRIIFYNNYIREEEGYIDITYPYNASQITRTIEAVDVTTKMFVRPITEDSAASGMLTITEVDANKMREDYLLNFDYLYTIGAITEEQYAEIPMYEARMRAHNLKLEELSSYKAVLDDEITDLEAALTTAENAAQLDQERIDESHDLLNSLDLKDTDVDGSITRDANNPSSAILIGQENSDMYYINISIPGIHRDTLHIYTKYNYVRASEQTNKLEGEISGTFVDDEFGNLVQVKDLSRPSEMQGNQVYLTYKYTPRLKYEQVEKIWTIRLSRDQQDVVTLTAELEEKKATRERVQTEYNELMADKEDIIAKFNRMMGPALRESYWQPEDYNANGGDSFNDQFAVPMDNTTPVPGASGHAQFMWDEEPFKEEQLTSYNLSAVETPISYPCVDLSDCWDFVVDNYSQISFMFYDYIKDDDDVYQIKYFKHYTLGSQAQLGFANDNGTIKPIMIITGAETHSLYTLRNMINARPSPAEDGPIIGIYTLVTVPDDPSDENSPTHIEARITASVPVRWLNLNTVVDGYNITTAAGFDAWIAHRFGQENNNIEIIGLAETAVWSGVNAVYPRIRIDSMLLKNDESLTLHANDALLEEYVSYYLLTRQVLVGENAYTGMNFLTIKPQYLPSAASLNLHYMLSNAQTAIYLDAIQVLKENAYPKVTYTISPTLIHRDFHYILHQLLNRIVNINDVDLKFDNVQGYISGLTINLDNPFNDKIEIKNYRNKFEDLFSSIVAQTESMKKNAYTIGLAAAAFTATGALAPAVIQQSINNIDLNYAFNQGNLTIDEENGIWAISDDGVVAMRGGGIFTATEQDDDGNWQWNTGILPSGINASLITTGQLDTNLIRVYAGDKLRFQLNGDGLFAYKSIFDDPDLLNLVASNAFLEPEQATRITNLLESQAGLDYKQYVVHDENGLFLKANSGAVVKVKNENNQYMLKQMPNDVVRVAISWDGLVLRDWNNVPTLWAEADTGDLTMRGALQATDLTILQTVKLGPETSRLTLDPQNGISINTDNFKLNTADIYPNSVWVNGEIQATSLKIGNSDAFGTVNEFVNASEVGKLVDSKKGALQVMSFDSDNGLVIQVPINDDPNNPQYSYWTSTTNTGYYIYYKQSQVASFTGNITTVQQLRIGDIIVKPTSSNGWKWVGV